MDYLSHLVFQNQFYEENRHAFVESNILLSLLSDIVSMKFANSFEHLIKTMQRTHCSKAVIRTKVALQEVFFDWQIYLRTLKML